MGKAVRSVNPLTPGTKRRIYLLNACLLIVPLAYFGYTPILTRFGDFLTIDETPAPSDVIVVLAGNEPGRALKAAELYRAGMAPYVVVTTEKPSPAYEQVTKDGVALFPSYENYVRILEGYGVPHARIIRIEDYVADTFDEMTRLRTFARSRRWTRILVVTSNYHSRRARMVARFLLEPEMKVVVVGSRYDGFRPGAWWKTQDGTRTFAIEMEKLIAYSLYIWPRRLWKTQGSTKPPSTSSALSDFF